MGFLMLLPIVQCLLFNLCIGRDPRELHIAVVNDEVPSLSECDSAPMSGCYIDSHLSCRYLDKLREKTINLVCYILWVCLESYLSTAMSLPMHLLGCSANHCNYIKIELDKIENFKICIWGLLAINKHIFNQVLISCYLSKTY